MRAKGISVLETDVEIKERWLYILARTSSKTTAKIPNIESFLNKNTVVCFLGASYADLSLPKQYDVIYNMDDIFERTITPIVVTFATPTTNADLVLSHLPVGYWTVVVLEFPEGIPSIIYKASEMDYQKPGVLIPALASYETWGALRTRKLYIEPVWDKDFMVLRCEEHSRCFEISKISGDAKRLFPHFSILSGIPNKNIRAVALRETDSEPQVVIVTYGQNVIFLGDVTQTVVPKMAQWLSEANELIENARQRQEPGKSGSA